MTWQLDYLVNEGIVAVKAFGPVNVQDIMEMAAESMEAAREHEVCAILVDASETKLTALTTELYRLPEMAEERGLTRHHRWALVISDDPAQKESLTFVETVFVNRGFQLHLFTGASPALDWLKRCRRPWQSVSEVASDGQAEPS